MASCFKPRIQVGEIFTRWTVGGRGISVCAEWMESYEAFLAHVGRRSGPEYSLDRYPDNDGNYEPGNVRWATREQQRANQERSQAA